jgi:hypothetical protein
VKNPARGFDRFHGLREHTKFLSDRLRSGFHRFWYEALQALGWSRGTVRERRVRTFYDLIPSQRSRIEELVINYGTPFEVDYFPETAFINYAHLDLLDRARQALNWPIPKKPRVCDLGSANFAYAAALHTFFQPAELVGVEVEGCHLFYNGRSRIDYARNHIHNLPDTQYVIADYRHYTRRADIITAWYPFVTPKPLLAWGLSLGLFNPGALFAQVAHNLNIGGLFVMINNSSDEAVMARGIAEDVGLVCSGQYVHEASLRSKEQLSVLTLWHHG